MSIRSNWCEYDKDTRKYIKKRDKEKCINCGAKGGLQIAHIFLSRAKGGKGCKENGVLLCVKCHKILDNPIGIKENELSKDIENKCKNYLIKMEKIQDIKEHIERLKFNKQEYMKKQLENKEIKVKEPIVVQKVITRCKDCQMLIKKKNNSTIPTYYCKYRKTRLNKSTKACDKFRRKYE